MNCRDSRHILEREFLVMGGACTLEDVSQRPWCVSTVFQHHSSSKTYKCFQTLPNEVDRQTTLCWEPMRAHCPTAVYRCILVWCFPSLLMEVTFPSSQTSSNFWVTSQTLKKSAHSHLKPPTPTPTMWSCCYKEMGSQQLQLCILTISEFLQWPTTPLSLESEAAWYTVWLTYLLSLMLGVWNLTYLLKSLKIGREFDY